MFENPVDPETVGFWIPAFAGMTAFFKLIISNDLKLAPNDLKTVIPAKAGIQFQQSKHSDQIYILLATDNRHKPTTGRFTCPRN
ncbi:MAG TPA: hypothetical protein ENK26_02300 [Gammaproteobacteria bacterium]|nr:hypothetical protein [Gammaproteobacteria bacterium]